MQELSALIGIALATSVGAMSPGPSFVMVAQTAASSRFQGFAAALGMGFGGLGFAVLSLLGLNSLFIAIPTLYAALKIAGGLYLAYLGLKIWRGAKAPLNMDAADSLKNNKSLLRSFLLGLSTQLSNPKTAIAYASVFATFMPAHPTLIVNIAIAFLVFVIETSWYSFVAFALSAQQSRAVYLKCKTAIDRVTGGIMFALGLKLVTSSATH